MSGTAPWFLQQLRDVNGAVLSGGKAYFWVAGSTVLPKAVYADYARTNLLTQPLVADASGTLPEYFMGDGLYKITVRAADDRLIATRDNVAGVGVGGSPSADSYTWKVSAADASAGYGQEKLGPTSTIIWTEVDIGGGVMQLRPSVVLGAVLDYKFKGDAADPIPGYMDAKIENGTYISLIVDPATHRLRADFVGPAYVPVTGGDYTGPVIFHDSVVLTVPGTGPLLGIDVAGNLTRVVLPGDDHLVIASLTDAIPGTLGVKLQAGAGLRFDTTVDVTLGEIISVSLINVPVEIIIPNTRVVFGNGTGVTSAANFTYTSQDLIAGYCEIESFFVSGDGPFATFHNTGSSTRNFRDGFSQHVNGDIRVGGAGSYGAIKITDATKIIDTGIDTTLRVNGKFVPKGVDISTPTYTLPELTVDGEQQVIRFTAATGTTVTAHSTQAVNYRDASTGVCTTAAGGAQVDGALIFGKHASSKVVTITLTRVDATTVSAVY